MPVIVIDPWSCFATAALAAVGGLTFGRYAAGFGLPKAWLIGPILSGTLIGSFIGFQVTSAQEYSLLVAVVLGTLISVPIVWSDLRYNRDKWW